MSSSRLALPNAASILPDLAAFAVGLGCARLLQWNTTDLVWSLWLSSLVLGYLSILSVIAKGLYIGGVVVSNEGFPAQYRGPALLIGLGAAAFVLMFFSMHFCGFHAVHGSILSGFFPLSGMPKAALGRGFINPIPLWQDAFHYVMPKYGIFLIPVAIAERRVLLGPFSGLVHAGRFNSIESIGPLLQASGASAHGLFTRPYANVIRMHVLIFFFAICHALKIDSFPVYVVVYSVYFFPWSALRKGADNQPAADNPPAVS